MLKQLFVIGIFLMVLITSSAHPATRFLEVDDTTGGDWSSKYGEDGYIICNVNGPQGAVVADMAEIKGNDAAELPGYIEDYVFGGGINGYVWQIDDDQPKILENPGGTKNAACWFTGGGDFTVDLPMAEQTSYLLAVYIDDWENGGREESLTLNDLDTGEELATHDFSEFGEIGKYGVFEVDRDVQLFVHYIPSYGNAVVSGVFFSGGDTAAVNSDDKLTTTWGKVKKSN